MVAEEVHAPYSHEGDRAAGEEPDTLAEDGEIEVEGIEMGQAVEVDAGVQDRRRGKEAEGQWIRTARVADDAGDYGTPGTPSR
jgi:hypothetical protein